MMMHEDEYKIKTIQVMRLVVTPKGKQLNDFDYIKFSDNKVYLLGYHYQRVKGSSTFNMHGPSYDTYVDAYCDLDEVSLFEVDSYVLDQIVSTLSNYIDMIYNDL